MHLPPNAVRVVTDVKTARPAKPIGTVLMSALPSVAAVIPVPTAASPDKSLFLALGMKIKSTFLLPNAETAAMNVGTTLTVTQQTKTVITVVHILTLVVNAQVVKLAHH